MRTAIVCLALGALTLAACSASVDTSAAPVGPLVEGEVLELTIWDQPVGEISHGEAATWGYDKDSGARVQVYENFIVVTDKHGHSRVAPHGWYERLLLK